MFCPHCNSNIPDGSNICPLCYGNIAGVKTQPAQEQVHPDAEVPQVKKAKPKKSKKPTYTKGSRGTKKNKDTAPMVIAIGLILILIIIIAMIVMSMFGAGDNTNNGVNPGNMNTAQTTVKQTPDVNLIVFGATPTPQAYVQVTPTPRIEVTPTPTPVPPVSYSTLRKGDEGPDVVTLQQRLHVAEHLFIRDITGQRIVGKRQRFIGAQACSS